MVTFINVILGMIFALVSIILTPINLLISEFIPALDDAFLAVGDLFSYITDSLGWAISVTGLSGWALSLIASYYVAKFMIPSGVYTFKLAVRWWSTLKR